MLFLQRLFVFARERKAALFSSNSFNCYLRLDGFFFDFWIVDFYRIEALNVRAG